MEPSPSGRGTFLAFLLVALFAAGSFVVCLGFFGPFAIEGLLIVGALAGVGLCHYFLWGRSLSTSVEAEREREEERPPWPTDTDEGPADERIRAPRF